MRFPRTRGDGPASRLKVGCRLVLPPHARGWTGAQGAAVSGSGASPARAGMDPCGPQGGTYANLFPPHARGWT